MLGFSVSAAVRAVIYGNGLEEAVECLPKGLSCSLRLKAGTAAGETRVCSAVLRVFPCLDLDLGFMRACSVGGLVTAWINFGLSMTPVLEAGGRCA